MAQEEEEEVRSLLSRHQDRIISDLQGTDLLAVLVKNSVLTTSEEEVLKSYPAPSRGLSRAGSERSARSSIYGEDGENSSPTPSAGGGSISVRSSVVGDCRGVTENPMVNDADVHRWQCANLIEIIAKSGFERFKQFCYAIENECPQLIEDLINDRLKCDTTTIVSSSSNEEKIKKELDSDYIEKDKDNDRSRRAVSYSGSTTNSVPRAAPRRMSLMKEPPPPPPPKPSLSHTSSINSSITAPSPIPSKFPQTEYNLIEKFDSTSNLSVTQQNAYQGPSTISNNYSSLLCHARSTTSPTAVRKREKLLHRFSDAATLGRKLKKKKNTNRTCHSMTEAIEMLADPVIEDEFFGDRTTWEYHTVAVTRVPGYGFGIAVSGGRDNPHFANGDPSIAVSDVLKGGPAEDRLQVNDRIISVNGVSLENVEYATAVQVLRDSGNTVTLVVKRRVPISSTTAHQHSHSMSSVGLVQQPLTAPGINTATASPILNAPGPGQPIKVTLTKSNKKDDYGVVLGCRLFIKEISTKARDQLAANGYVLQEGDIISRIHNTNCGDTMSLKEAKKIIDGCKERLNLVVLRDITNQGVTTNVNSNHLNNSTAQSSVYSHTQQVSNCSNNLDDPYLGGGASYSSQNLYVQPPTRSSNGPIGLVDEKSNLTPRGRSRGPLMDVSLSQLDRPSTPSNGNSSRARSDEPPRPPPPRGSGAGEDFYSSRRQLYEEDPLQRSRQSAEPRFISFQKEGSVGIRLTGGNEAGIFVTAVQPGSPASLQGLTPGDKILKVNDMDMHGVTREEAVLFLLSLQDRIDLIVQYCKEEYEEVVANQRGDSFHIKTHFHCDNPSKGEMAFKAGDVFRVIDTLHNGVVGSWQVLRIGRGHQEMQRGVIPNKSRAEELATAQFNATKKEMNASESRGNFFRRRRSTHRRSKSLSRENWDDVVFSDSISKFPAYERVVLRHPGFVRPVVLFGPVSDISREKLTKDFPDKFTAPLQDDDKTNSKCRIVRLSNIRDIMDRGKHALLDITPNAVDRLNYAQFYPIVIFLKTDSKHVIKQLRHGIPKSAHKSSKKLLEQCQKLERVWSHVFSTQIVLNDTESWYRKLREAIDLQQSGAVWMSETKPVESLSDDFLFPMTTSRLSYASSPESDLELSPGPSTSLSLGNLPQLVKSSSDPSIATNQDNLDRDRDIIGEGLPPPYTNPYEQSNPPQNRRQTMDTSLTSKYNYPVGPSQSMNPDSNSPPSNTRPQSLYGINAPDLPPRVDRHVKPSDVIANTPPSRTSSSGGTIARSAQERLFGKPTVTDDVQAEYVSRSTTNDSVDRTQQSSLDRQQRLNSVVASPLKPTQQNGSAYDSVSSYDSYNTTQLASIQNVRLGPNAPDDLKSVPNANVGRPGGMNSNVPEFRSAHDHHTRNFIGANDLNRQSSPGRPQYHDLTSARNIDPRNAALNTPARPSNLGLENSPRKQVLETKTDYGKYSRNNSASQADYSKIPKNPHGIAPPPNVNSNGNGTPNGNGGPFKPVPPPKPKNYRPPMQGSGQWENGEPGSPRSPNGFFYPPTPSHYHHSQTPGSPHTSNGSSQQNHIYGTSSGSGGGGHYNGSNQQTSYVQPNGYNGSGHPYSGGGGQQYMHRSHPPPITNLPPHTPERHALDLAGSREQRGSAFELYRKPQIGAAGHHHNMSDMEPYDERYNNYYQVPQHPSRAVYPSDPANNVAAYHQHQQYYNMYPNSPPPPLPKVKKKSVLKSPLTAIKNALIKSTRPLRRMNSMVEQDKKSKPLRRQYSMMERGIGRLQYPDDYPTYPAAMHDPRIPYNGGRATSVPPRDQYYAREQEDMNSTYQNLESEDIYGNIAPAQSRQAYDDLYSNRALIDLERRQAEMIAANRGGGRRIIRRHSTSVADRGYDPRRKPNQRIQSPEAYACEDIYQSRQGAYMLTEPRRPPNSEVMTRRRFYPDQMDISEDHIYQTRREVQRNQIYQSKKEMQERITAGKKDIEREFSPPSSSQSERDDKSERDSIYQSRREVKESGLKTRSQLREQIYQTRREAMESMAEPIYVSKRDVVRPEPIYETKEESSILASGENETDEKKEEKTDSTVIVNGNGGESNGSSQEETLNNSKQSDLQLSADTVIEKTVIPALAAASLAEPEDDDEFDEDEEEDEEETRDEEEACEAVEPLKPLNSPTAATRSPYHKPNMRRTAASRTSLETQYTSQASLPIGPPNATSTPYASDMSLPMAGPVAAPTISGGSTSQRFPTVPREPTTTKGIFDHNGGTLADNFWNVSLQIPPGAIPLGVKQEIYFTVSDPRMGETVGGPPLDMENGETMLSPLVMCGPQGLEFLVPVTLNIPHCAGRTASLGLALKATDSEKNLHTEWDNIDLPSNAAAHTVSVKVDHF
ncbi:uncharacterized protein LOC129940651 isoform X1 [Eupeodes corollae]|uniref:uncharacterized protein LOC129940651 isoform X1 n=1 Tax=Eupeodes corollae TaxID=290404 RepID=UPI002492F57A|nr:uncharacterized protein LOC129940651 isoform X1 [Eupeodes corollae]